MPIRHAARWARRSDSGGHRVPHRRRHQVEQVGVLLARPVQPDRRQQQALRVDLLQVRALGAGADAADVDVMRRRCRPRPNSFPPVNTGMITFRSGVCMAPR